jgi:tetraacyldisaccharide 4'-kinase
MKLLPILAFPLALLYGTINAVRNKFYDWGIFPSRSFTVPTISVGNLCTGGSGKTPHIEYLIRLLRTEFYIATLSRGYGRKTSGFILSDTQSTTRDIGDEPLQFKKKFSGLRVAVDGDRVRGIQSLMTEFPSLQAILLDDAFQHRAVKPGLSLLLTDFSRLYRNDHVLPSGNLREFRSGAERADVIIVTKCPQILLPIERKRLISEIGPRPYQRVYFSFIRYGDFIPVYGEGNNPLSKEYYFERNYSILLLTGIANTRALEYYLKGKVKNIIPLKFPDHHYFSEKDLVNIKKTFEDISSGNKIILTTEKDAMRLKAPEYSEILKKLPVFQLPIEIDFHDKDKEEFNEQILHYVRANQKNSSVYSK